MDKNVSEEVPQLTIRLNNNENIKLPLSTFNNLLTQEITKFIKKNEKNIKDIIDFKKQSENLNELKSKFYVLEKQADVLNCITNRLKRDLKINEFAKPLRCTAVDKNTYVKIHLPKFCKAIAFEKRNNEQIIFALSDSEEEKTTNISTLNPKPGSKSTTNVSVPNVNDNNKVLSFYDADKTLNNRRHVSIPFAKRKPGPKSKTMYVEERFISNTENKVTVTNKICDSRDITNKISNCVDCSSETKFKVLSINTESCKTLNNKKCVITKLSKRKPGPKSKTMYIEDRVLSKSENNNSKVINNKKLKTNLSECRLVTELKPTENPNPKSCLKISSKKYPPPFPEIPPHDTQPLWKNVPPMPEMTINILGNKVTLTWNLCLTRRIADIKMYELFVCQETDAHPETSMWKKKGSLKAERLPMACELEMFALGYVYHFALRAVDIHNRRAPFALLRAKI